MSERTVENDAPETYTREDMARAWDEGFRFESDYLDTWGQFCPFENARNPYRDIPPDGARP